MSAQFKKLCLVDVGSQEYNTNEFSHSSGVTPDPTAVNIQPTPLKHGTDHLVSTPKNYPAITSPAGNIQPPKCGSNPLVSPPETTTKAIVDPCSHHAPVSTINTMPIGSIPVPITRTSTFEAITTGSHQKAVPTAAQTPLKTTKTGAEKKEKALIHCHGSPLFSST
ncbi:hypothetical protein G4B88_014096 [Cannabis sativa]|uniref:Uncharacterized protein n=1 Tax=Cannabis sativa TaxID=3483 RepID=A0A7J6I203_CANSA|nr:hypothetical protein G4B88_014096 [Cannabis sativa]